MRQNITEHEGKKYIRTIQSCLPAGQEPDIHIDVYAVFKAFNVTDQPVGHAIKKLLALGERGKGSKLDDLKGALAAINRAIDQEMRGPDERMEAAAEGLGKRKLVAAMFELVKKHPKECMELLDRLNLTPPEFRAVEVNGSAEINVEAFMRP